MSVSLHTDRSFWWRGVRRHQGDDFSEQSDYWARVINHLRLTETAGGGGAPEWVPIAPSGDIALAYADFVNGHYYAGGTEVLLADIIADPTMRTTSGFVVAGSGPVGQFIGPLLTQLLLPAKTVRIKVTRTGSLTDDRLVLVVNNADDSNELLFVGLEAAQYYDNAHDAGIAPAATPGVSLYGIAVTHSTTSIVGSWNGLPIHTATSEAVSPVATQAISGAYGTGGTVFSGGGFIVTEIAVLPSQADADLPGLSAL